MNRPAVVISALLGVIVVGILVLALRGSSSTASGRLDVVAAENFYGNMVAQIGGSHVAVTSILSDPNADPHLFEPGTSNGLAVANASLVIQNGVGYDMFMNKLEAAAPNAKRKVITIADVLGVTSPDANPHLWYNVPRLDRIAQAITSGLEQADREHKGAYRAGLRKFKSGLGPLKQEVATIRSTYGGEAVAYTEPVPGYLLEAAGLRSLTPEPFARAIEDGSDPTPQAVSQMTALFSQHRVKVLLYNSQTVSAITSEIKSDAQTAGIPVVGVSETLPRGMSFQRWQLSQAQALQQALAK